MNDVYRIEGLDDGKVGGLARLRTLRAELEAAAPGRVLLLHGGDVIFPSLLSREYQGKQMIDVMNLLDGDATPGRIDERMLVVFGNHEFDSESCAAPPHLQARVAESDFLWLSSNVAPGRCPDGRPRLTGVNVLHARILDVGGIRVGLFGLTIPIPRKDVAFLDPLATATALTADLRRRGAEVVIAVTHLPKEEDERIYAALRERGLDLIVGGHEHEHMALPPGDTPRIFKADADAATAWVITLRLGSDGRVRVEASLREMDGAIRPDPAVAGRVAQWLERHAAEFCAKQGKPASCLAEPLATTRTPLVAEEEKVRGAETSARQLGDRPDARGLHRVRGGCRHHQCRFPAPQPRPAQGHDDHAPPRRGAHAVPHAPLPRRADRRAATARDGERHLPAGGRALAPGERPRVRPRPERHPAPRVEALPEPVRRTAGGGPDAAPGAAGPRGRQRVPHSG